MNLTANNKHKIYLPVITALLAACFFSCKKDRVVADDNILIVGKWNLKSKTLKQIANGVTIRDEVSTDINDVNYQFKTDNSLVVQTDTEHSFTMQYTLVGDSLTFIHTESKEHYGAKEYFRIKKLTNIELQLSYSPKDNEPYLTSPEGTYIEMNLSK